MALLDDLSHSSRRKHRTLRSLQSCAPPSPRAYTYLRPLHSIPPRQQPLPHDQSRWLLPAGKDFDHSRIGRTRLCHLWEDYHNIPAGRRPDFMRRRSADEWGYCVEQPTRSDYCCGRLRSHGVISNMDRKEDQGPQCDGRSIASQPVISGHNDAPTTCPIL